jgi:DNA polymerase-3 subunit delta'
VVLVYPAERMNHVTANALLKTLEEPPGDVKFVLATEASHLLLPTIRSRCMGHAMAWPETSAALDWLAAQGFPPADARTLLRIAGGRPDDALLLGRSGPPAESWPRLPRALARGDVGALSGFTPAQAITVLQKLCHDLLSQGCGAPPRFFDAADLPETSARMSIARLSGWAQSLARAARTAEHPFNPGLALEDLATQAHHIFHLP